MKRIKLMVRSMVMLLVLLLAAPIVWAGQVGQAVDMPEYTPSLALEVVPIVAADCRDVFAFNQTLIYVNRTGAEANTFYTLKTETWKKAGNDPTEDPAIKHKGAAVLTDKTVYQGESQPVHLLIETYMKSEKLLAGSLTVI